jgi:DNA invertase Pin-like site-specific DNA recombinase
LRRREVVAIVVWKLDRRGRSLPDLIAPLAELRDLGIVVLLPTEALPLSSGSRSLW